MKRNGAHHVRPTRRRPTKATGGKIGISLANEAQATFIASTHNPERQIEAAEKFVGDRMTRSTSRLVTGGAMLLELSNCLELSEVQRLEYLGRSNELLRLAVSTDLSKGKIKSLRARSYLANIGIFQSFALGDKPTSHRLDTAYEENIQYIRDLEKSAATAGSDQARMRLAGARSEAIVIGLLQRDERQNLGDGSFIAVPSMYSEDNSVKSGSELSQSWDVSTYADPDNSGSFYLANRIQVKNNRENVRKYDPDITIVCPPKDLALTPDNFRQASATNRSIPAQVITAELLAEHDGEGQHVSSTLDRRTSQLIDIIG